MFRRKYIGVGSLFAGMGILSLLAKDFSIFRRVYYRIENLFLPAFKLPPDSERAIFKLPAIGEKVSVELALNSRCCSDYDGNPKKSHWGMFDLNKRLSRKQIDTIITLARIPRFTKQRIEIRIENNILYFVMDNQTSGVVKDWMMVESGMQQQAIGLVCAAMGVGMVFKSLGNDGEALSDSDYANTRIKLDALAPSYKGSFWSSSPPKGWKSYLPDPIRDGNKALIPAMENLKIENTNGKKSTDGAVSQLLWAARGRTPHYYKARSWGMTIPTSHGEQKISSVFLISDGKLFKYSNWNWNRPTHALDVIKELNQQTNKNLHQIFTQYNCFIVLGKNEISGRALWEVGYQILNLLLQAHLLGIAYKAILLEENQRETFRQVGIKDPVAVMLLQQESPNKI